MSIFTGTTELANVYVGSTEVTSVYVGTNQVWNIGTVAEGRLFTARYATYFYLEELDLDTLTVIASHQTTLGSGTYTGMGGINGRIFVYKSTDKTIYELDPDDGSILNSNTPNSNLLAYGIGGNQTTLYLGNNTTNGGLTRGFYEIDPDNLTLGTAHSTSFDTAIRGICAIGTTPYATGTQGDDTIYELESTNFTSINSATFVPSGATEGGIKDIGSTNDRLFTGRLDSDYIYEIDPDTLTVVNSASYTNPLAVGGVKE